MHDYIVVGGGSAGCVLASRLSEDPTISVLLLEAGRPTDPELTAPPATSTGRTFTTSYDWGFYSEPERSLRGRRNYLPRGRGLGGTTILNGMVHMRGSAADFDDWEAVGAKGWSFPEVAPYFLRAEGAAGYRDPGTPGLHVDDSRYHYSIAEAWVAAAETSDRPRVADFNDWNDQDRVGLYRFLQTEGRRDTAADAYLTPVLDRPNLQIVTDALVTRVLFDGSRAVGVVAEVGGTLARFEAAAEVVLTAGAYNSPQLLMLSGIGPAAQLRAHGVDVLVDLQVGENLQDHPAVTLGMATSERTVFSEVTPAAVERWRTHRDGPVSSGVVQCGGFFRTRPELGSPDVQTLVTATAFLEEGLSESTSDAFVAMVCQLRAYSRGAVTLRSNVPSAKVRIRHNQLADRRDVDCLVDGLRINMDILDRAPIADMCSERMLYPESDSREHLEDFVRRTAQGLYHPVGSCSMGSVLDEELRVLGVEGLRVADAAAIPLMPRGNINAAITMVAEKAADLIRGRALQPLAD